MSGILAATATFQRGYVERLLNLYVQVHIFTAVKKTQRIVEQEAHALVPVASGGLDASIHSTEPVNDGQRIVGSVVADAGHASFVEFGTGLRGIGTYPFPLPQENVPFTGSWVYDYKNQQWVGMPAQPFLRPALDTARAQALSEFQEAVR